MATTKKSTPVAKTTGKASKATATKTAAKSPKTASTKKAAITTTKPVSKSTTKTKAEVPPKSEAKVAKKQETLAKETTTTKEPGKTKAISAKKNAPAKKAAPATAKSAATKTKSDPVKSKTDSTKVKTTLPQTASAKEVVDSKKATKAPVAQKGQKVGPQKIQKAASKTETIKKTEAKTAVKSIPTVNTEKKIAKHVAEVQPLSGEEDQKSVFTHRRKRRTEEETPKEVVIARRQLGTANRKTKGDEHNKVMESFHPKRRSLLESEEESKGPIYRYSDEDLKEFKEIILERLEKARQELAYLQGVITRKSEAGTDDTDNRYNHLEDSSTLEREKLSQLASRQVQFIRHLENALIRIENKTYGICRITGKLISKERLRVVPHATLSIEAKKMRK